MTGLQSDHGHQQQPPPAEGARLLWPAIPAQVRAAIERELGSPVVTATSQPSGFSPGVAARLRTADGQRVFIKAVGPDPNPDVPAVHRREAEIVARLPSGLPVPRLLWSVDDRDDTGWVALVFEEVDGKLPDQPWRAAELERVLDTLVLVSEQLTPSPIPLGDVPSASERFESELCGWRKLQETQGPDLTRLDAWSMAHLDTLAEIEATTAVAGDTLLHFDIRADNLLLTPEKVWLVDWPHACVGAAWVDVLLFAPSVAMQGGPLPETLLARHPACVAADPAAIVAATVSMAGFFTYKSLQPAPPGLPTLRAFQAAQGQVACEWLARLIG